VRVNETSEMWGECGVLICSSVDIQAATYGLTAVHMDLVRGLILTCLLPSKQVYQPGRPGWGNIASKKSSKESETSKWHVTEVWSHFSAELFST
jgi:hypothetical protein